MDRYSQMGLSAQTTIVDARREQLRQEAAEARLLRSSVIDETQQRPVAGRSLRRVVVAFFERQVAGRPGFGPTGRGAAGH